MIEPVSGAMTGAAVAKKAADALEPAASEFASNVTGAPSKELGAWFADHVRFRRWKAQVRLIKKAAKFAEEAGIDAQAVPLKTLAPLLEGASFEEEADEDMADRWAALLANAADATGDRVPPSFPGILAEMTPLEARIMDQIFDYAQQHPRDQWLQHGLRTDGIASFFAVPQSTVDVAVGNLFRLRLASPPAGGFEFTTNKEHRYLIAAGADLVCLTEFGDAFVRACRAPKGSAAELVSSPAEAAPGPG